ncbi:methyltransferase domain-containing protein [Nesterenkonia flava]|uniref:Methyltransferase domain-containing protein n=1 Tax=Nesterenkonia flava TaxID=469799 RepID=A0ABU1FTH5_9MICC|nr:methyltransferase domain-containing protein [Nesterenkonia flava]MDR5711908.1 methyltransferase domain-containing protein [Nesterenkonia flava]
MPRTSPGTHWNPGAYLTYASERTQPFIDLLQRVKMPQARTIVDLGCGPGNGMPVLRQLWPEARIIGIDSSEEMLERARTSTAEDAGIEYLQADIRTFELEQPADLIVSNAALQWIPEHRQLLPRIQNFVAETGVLAVQIPGNHTAPSHRLLFEYANRDPYRRYIDPASLLQPTGEVSDYMLDVAGAGWHIEGWETRYHHVLQGEDPVYDWVAAAAARPVLQALPQDLLEQFAAEYKAALREAYPRTALGTILPFRRLFIVARRTH